MKVKIHILLLLCVLLGFVSCGRKRYPQSLITADSLASVDPDSAIALLKSMEDTMQAEPRVYLCTV